VSRREKCKCECCCCGPSFDEVRKRLHDELVMRSLNRAIILPDSEYEVYAGGLVKSNKYRDTTLFEAGIENLMFHTCPVVPMSEMSKWKAYYRRNYP